MPGSPLTNPGNMHRIHFTPLQSSEPAGAASDDVPGPSRAAGGSVIKSMAPYVSLKTALVVLLAVSILVAVVVAVVVTVANKYSHAAGTSASGNLSDTSTLSTVTSYTSTTTSSSSTSTIPESSTSAVTPSTTETSTLTETTTLQNLCNKSEFMCLNGECIASSQVCNGIPECSDGSDESSLCVCTDDQFQCSGGQCVSKSAICDQRYDCYDQSDEANCPDCAGFRCKSNNVCLWDQMYNRCNTHFDCLDLSDEMDCRPRPNFKYCLNGVQISNKLFCNGIDDCGDNSDEMNCTCHSKAQFRCASGSCILTLLRCDGTADCQDGSDEEKCGNCNEDQVVCRDYKCVNKSMRCDGKIDCLLGGDEDDCVELTSKKELQVMMDKEMLTVCSEGWKDADSVWVCSSLQNSTLVSWSANPITSSSRGRKFAVLRQPELPARMHNFQISDACKTGALVHISCQKSECGRRKVEVLESLIAGGNIAPLGKWPWVVSLSYLGKPICGAVMISAKWALTAAHCIMNPIHGTFNFTQTVFYFSITVGTTSIYETDLLTTAAPQNQHLQAQTVRVSSIKIHPASKLMDSGRVDWDIALLQLDTEVQWSSHVQPICLPSADQEFLPTSYCYIAGWGLLTDNQYLKPKHLRDARMILWSESRCQESKVAGETSVNTNSTLCGGHLFGIPTNCQGDSGGPLMCLDLVSDHYMLAGIISSGGQRCGERSSSTPSNRYARVATTVSWIHHLMEAG